MQVCSIEKVEESNFVRKSLRENDENKSSTCLFLVYYGTIAEKVYEKKIHTHAHMYFNYVFRNTSCIF